MYPDASACTQPELEGLINRLSGLSSSAVGLNSDINSKVRKIHDTSNSNMEKGNTCTPRQEPTTIVQKLQSVIDTLEILGKSQETTLQMLTTLVG